MKTILPTFTLLVWKVGLFKEKNATVENAGLKVEIGYFGTNVY